MKRFLCIANIHIFLVFSHNFSLKPSLTELAMVHQNVEHGVCMISSQLPIELHRMHRFILCVVFIFISI